MDKGIDFDFKDIKETIHDIKKDIEKIEESDKSKKEKVKLKKNLIEEEKQKIDKIMEVKGTSTDDIKEVKEVKETIDDMIEKIENEEQPKKEVKTSTDKETNIIEALSSGYEVQGEVSKKEYIHKMIQAEYEFRHRIGT